MANQNFRVKKGLEVGLGATYLYADDTGVGINSNAPRVNLDVRGTANIDELEVGPGGLVGLGSTAFKVNGNALIDGDVRITGDLIFDDAVIDDLFVSGIATINELDYNVGTGGSLTVGVLTAGDLTVTGFSTFNGPVIIDAPLGVTSSVAIGKSLFVGGGAVISGGVTFNGSIGIDIDVNVDLDGNINQSPSGIATFGELNFNVGIGSTLTVGDLFVTGEVDVNGTGIATIGGDPVFNSLSVTGFSTFGGLNTTGFSTFYQNVRIEEDLEVGGNIELLDLNAGNISVGGTIYTNGLEFNSGVGTALAVGFGSIGIATVSELNVTGFATFGGLNTTGFSTFYQNLRVDGDLAVTGDIALEDLDSGNITVGGTVTTNGLEFNTGIGTFLELEELVVTGISSLNIITGIGSELQFLPAGSISTSVGVGSTQPPTLRPTGEPVQPGDLWFDAEGLRQYTYFVQAGVQTGIWVDSSPPPIQPDLGLEGDFGGIGRVDLARANLNILGTPDQILTYVNPVSLGQTITVGLTTDVTILGDLSLPLGFVTALGVDISGVGTFNRIEAQTAAIDSVTIGDITVGDITVGEVGIDTLRFNTGFGTELTISDNLQLSGIASRDGAALVAQGDQVGFNTAVIAGIVTLGTPSPTLGFVTTRGDLYVGGDLYIADDLTFDEASLRKLNVSETAGINTISFKTGIGTELDISGDVSVGGTFGAGGLAYFSSNTRVTGDLSATGIVSALGQLQGASLDVTGNVEGTNFTASNNISAGGNLSAVTAGITTLSVTGELKSFGDATFSGPAGFGTATVNTELSVPGVSSFVGLVEFSDSVGYALTVQRLVVPPAGFVELPGIPVVGGAASFSQLVVTGIASFTGFTTITGDVAVSGAMTVGSLTADTINFSGGTGIGSDNISTEDLNISGQSDLTDLNVSGVSTFVGVGTFQDDLYVADDLFVKRDLLVGRATTTGILSASTAVITDLVITGDLKGASGDAIIVDGDGVITGVVTIGTNSITLDGRAGREYIEIGTGSGDRIVGLNTFTGERSYVQVDEGRFNNFINVSGINSTSTFEGDVNIKGGITVEGDISFEGEVVGVTSFQNLEVTGIATIGFLTATNASVAGIITAQNFNSLSDQRVKENIEPILDPLSKVAKLNGVKYTFINSGKKSVGVIAQEVEKVFPELIAGTFPKSVNYNGLTGLLIEAVKELKEQNEELKRRLDKLEG